MLVQAIEFLVAEVIEVEERIARSFYRTDELVEIWSAACEQTGAMQCATTTEL